MKTQDASYVTMKAQAEAKAWHWKTLLLLKSQASRLEFACWHQGGDACCVPECGLTICRKPGSGVEVCTACGTSKCVLFCVCRKLSAFGERCTLLARPPRPGTPSLWMMRQRLRCFGQTPTSTRLQSCLGARLTGRAGWPFCCACLTRRTTWLSNCRADDPAR